MNDEPEDDEPAQGQFSLSFDFETKKVESFIENVRDFTFSLDDKKIAIAPKRRSSSAPPRASRQSPKVRRTRNPVNPSTLQVPPARQSGAGGAQIFAEVRRLQRDFYWDQKMVFHRLNAMRPLWGAAPANRHPKRTQRPHRPASWANSAPHTPVRGGDVESACSVNTGLWAPELTPDQTAKTFRLSHIYRPESLGKPTRQSLLAPHARVKEGDFWAINGVDVGMTEDVYAKPELWSARKFRSLLAPGPTARCSSGADQARK